jgi:serine phosphatase RsbU (regulator of sigma subunit)
VLEWLHRTLLATPDSVYCSAIHGALRLNKHTGVSVEFANAGHPRPIHISGGQVTVVEGAGAIAGALSDFDEPPSVSLLLVPGDVLIMYTDGLLESPAPRLATEDLVAHLRRAVSAGGEVMDVIDDLIAAGQEPGNDDSDDTAVLVLSVDEVGSLVTGSPGPGRSGTPTASH